MDAKYRIGNTAAIRAHLGTHPGATSRDLAAALALDVQTICRALWRMVEQGVVKAEAVARRGDPQHYTLTGLKAGDVPKQKRSAAMRVIITAAALPTKKAPPGEHESVEHFLERGGKVDRLPSCWDEYRPHASVPMPSSYFMRAER